MTQLEAARKGIITEAMKIVAADEGLAPEAVRDAVATGEAVIPLNIHHTNCPFDTTLASSTAHAINSIFCLHYFTNFSKTEESSSITLSSPSLTPLTKHPEIWVDNNSLEKEENAD